MILLYIFSSIFLFISNFIFLFINRKCDECYYLSAFMCPTELASSLHLKVIIFCFVVSLFISVLFSFQCCSNSRLVDVNIISNPLKLNSQFLFFFFIIIFFQGKVLSIIAAGMKALENEDNICLLETTE